MKFAIIAAGEGSRLAREGVKAPKPLIKLQGIPIIERLVMLFASQGASSINIIINEQQPDTLALLQKLQKRYPINIVVKDTPSSMHSLHALSHLLRGEKFCLTTVDTIFKEKEFTEYIKSFKNSADDALMAVTDYIDDEKPLYVATDLVNNITGFYDNYTDGIKYISGGIYALTPPAIDVLNKCIELGVSRMRNYQRALIENGLKLKAAPFSKVIDIDHATDIVKAEQFIAESQQK